MTDLKKDNLIVQLTTEFSLELIRYAEVLEQQRKYVIGNQLLRAGTSIGANVREAQNAESRTDFVHKMKIAAKESSETGYWLFLCENSESYPKPNGLTETLNSIDKVLGKILSTSKRKLNEI